MTSDIPTYRGLSVPLVNNKVSISLRLQKFTI